MQESLLYINNSMVSAQLLFFYNMYHKSMSAPTGIYIT